jgi:hypothetical protein
VILFVDMQSGESFTTGVAGYYWPGDLFAADAHPSVADSNEMEVFYINMAYVNVFLTNGGPMNANILGTIAHEFQHMINFAQRVWQDKPAMDTWIDEGLSEGSEHYVLGTPNTHRIDYMEHPKIVNGTVGLVKWTGDLANYALSYTFLQYYRMQTGGAWAAYTDLIQHPYGDYRALLSGLQGAGSSLDSFRSLMRGYRLANLFRADGIYGYGSLNAVMDFRLGAPSVNVSTLPSGAAVYYQLTAAALQSYQPSGQGPNMIYVKVQSE